MSEQPTATQTVQDEGVQPPYTWQQLAEDLPSMHEGLQIHGERLLAEHGVTLPSPGEVTVASTVEVVDPIAEEAPLENVEQNQTTAEERKEAFAFGLQTLYKMTMDQKLQAKCEEAGIDPTDVDDPAYWRMVANHAKERVSRLRDLTGDSLRLHAIELVASTPAYLLEQSALRRGQVTDPHVSGTLKIANGKRLITGSQNVTESLKIVSDYHSAMTELVQKYPDIKASELEMGLLDSVNVTIEDDEVRRAAGSEIRRRISGVQHEVGFEDILRQTGIRYRRATQIEDRQGFDFILNEGSFEVMRLDVKARLKEVTELGSDGPIAKDDKGIYIIFSMIGDAEFRGGFHLSDEVAKEKAKKLLEILDGVDQYSSAQIA